MGAFRTRGSNSEVPLAVYAARMELKGFSLEPSPEGPAFSSTWTFVVSRNRFVEYAKSSKKKVVTKDRQSVGHDSGV